MTITISDRAEKNFKQIYRFIEHKFSKSACDKFKKRLKKVIDIIASNPELFAVSELNPVVRRCVVT